MGFDPALFDLLCILGLVVLNGFFAAAEFAVISSRPEEIRRANGSARSRDSAIWLIDKLDLSMSCAQLGMTVTSLLLGWVGIGASYDLFQRIFAQLGFSPGARLLSILAVSFALLGVVLLHLVLGEIVAKSLAIRYPERTLRIVAGPVRLCTAISRPLIYFITGTANGLLRLFGTSISESSERFHSVSDISMLVSEGTERGVFDKDEEQMIRGVFGFSETVTREVMTPRTALVTININADLPTVLHTVVDSGFSRYPVTGSGMDDAVGILLARDLLPLFERYLSGAELSFQVKKMMREPYFVPGTKPVDDLLNEFKRRKIHMAIVLDEHGGVDGVVTLEDLLEEIVGDIWDESDELLPAITVQEDGDVVVEGGTFVQELNERFRLDIPLGDYDTIGGFIFNSLGRIPKVGDTVYVAPNGELSINEPPVVQEEGELLEAAANDGYSRVHSSSETPAADPAAAVSVERVVGHRIEQVRIRRKIAEVSETPPPQLASEVKGILPNKDM